MKKLVVITVIALSAMIAKASSVNWSLTASSTYAGYSVYLVSELAEFTNVADIQSKLLGTAGNTGTLSTGRSAVATGIATVNDAAGSTVNFYYVIVGSDASAGYWSIASSAEAYTTASTHTDSAVLKATADALFSTTPTAWATGGGGGGGDSPEPTSGLLLLVGAGILGLRRKRV